MYAVRGLFIDLILTLFGRLLVPMSFTNLAFAPSGANGAFYDMPDEWTVVTRPDFNGALPLYEEVMGVQPIFLNGDLRHLS